MMLSNERRERELLDAIEELSMRANASHGAQAVNCLGGLGGMANASILGGLGGMANASIRGYGEGISNAYRAGTPSMPTQARRYRGSRYDDGKHVGRRFGNQE